MTKTLSPKVKISKYTVVKATKPKTIAEKIRKFLTLPDQGDIYVEDNSLYYGSDSDLADFSIEDTSACCNGFGDSNGGVCYVSISSAGVFNANEQGKLLLEELILALAKEAGYDFVVFKDWDVNHPESVYLYTIGEKISRQKRNIHGVNTKFSKMKSGISRVSFYY